MPLICWLLSKKEIKKSLFELLKFALKSKIIIPYLFLLVYSFFAVILLKKFRIWNISNIKETIYWFIFSGVIIVFTAVVDEKTDRPFKKILSELITFTILLEFIVNTYVFKLPMELLFVPLITFLVIMNTFSSSKSEYKIIEKFSGALLSVIGIIMLIYVSVKIYKDFHSFASIDTLIDFIIPPILTICILPAIYLLLLYTFYDSLFIRVGLMLDSTQIQWYAKKLIIFHCGFSINKAKQILKNNVNLLYETASKEKIKGILPKDN